MHGIGFWRFRIRVCWILPAPRRLRCSEVQFSARALHGSTGVSQVI